jgi:carbon monoxide dehydrogenase subunit G
MKLEIKGDRIFSVPVQTLWDALNDPKVLAACIPGCKEMVETGPDQYRVILELKVAAVGGSFEGAIALTDKVEPQTCRITVSGEGTLGHGTGTAEFSISADGDGSALVYNGSGEIGGLVAGVGQRVLGSVSKHLVKRFFKALDAQLVPVN